MTTINYLLSLSSRLLTAPGKHTVFLSCFLSLMLILGSSAYGRLYLKGDILLSPIIRKSRGKREMTSRQTTFSFSGYQKRCITLCSPRWFLLTPSRAKPPLYTSSLRSSGLLIKSHVSTCKLGHRFIGNWLYAFILISLLSQKETTSRGRGHMYTSGWFTLMFGRNQHNSVKQLSFN